jgi:Raf kinase inhibitor-like YbhB/YbcL family protein
LRPVFPLHNKIFSLTNGGKIVQRKKYLSFDLSCLFFVLFLISSIPCGATSMPLTLSSPQFVNEGSIPSRYTCDAANYSIPLAWKNTPQNTQSFVLIMDDPDAPMGTWDHWLVFNIPPTVHSFAENLHSLPAGAKGGQNSFKNNVYGGPCPPDREHRYFFKLYALDAMLDLPEGASKTQIEKALQGHILEQTQLMGKYNRIGR